MSLRSAWSRPTTSTLKVGSESQTVEVQATGVELQTLNATVGNQVSGLCAAIATQHRARHQHLPDAAVGHQP